MSSRIENAERAALRAAAHALPEKWREIIDVAAAAIPPTPEARIPAPEDPAAKRLDQVEHIVVVMMENRSFDHMLGYLSLPPEMNGRGRMDVNGLRGPDQDVNHADGTPYPIHHLTETEFTGEAQDPDHSGHSVDEQIADGAMSGFAQNFARISKARAAKLKVPVPDPGMVMGYYDADDLPVYDHLAAQYCVVDRWFSSVPGATWPNRLYAVAGRAAGTRDDVSPPLYDLPSFVRHLDDAGVDWGWYSFDPATLRAVDPAYRLSHHNRFSYVDARKLSTREREIDEVLQEDASFLDDIANNELPKVSWIDPRFKDLRVLGPDSNDDHPPSDVLAGQDLVLTIYHALTSNPAIWAKTLLIITYDEHGGFYDHIAPPTAADEDQQFQRLGVRVPALLVSPLVAPGSTSHGLPSDIHFDHTSIMKTIFATFCQRDGEIPAVSARAAAAHHLGHLLHDEAPRGEVADHSKLVTQLAQWHADLRSAGVANPTAGTTPKPLTDFQSGFYEMARLLRHAGLPGGHP
jgi:phospholipase C